MNIEFDPAKDASNIVKHGISLSRAVEMDGAVYVEDDRYDEPRFRVYGLIDDVPHCAAIAIRGQNVRVISLRRAHRKEFKRHV
ncbi:BrnT family toxin [Novosphingobium sp. 9]|uniref:BrnT family toxin n=1 Tax=Novosphingobium sp. 9 TaxID=2025349 RepID=UPI0021B51A3D|nr:BrnT family toxin [Novosphingobium sp. 9]